MTELPAGWYPDPLGGGMTYWDGYRWVPFNRPIPRTRSVNHGMWWLVGILGGIAVFLFGGIILWPVFVLLWMIGYAADAAGAHMSREKAKRAFR